MTREEQIRQAGIEYTIKDRPMCIGGGAFSEIMDEMNRNHAFEEGAKWADKTMIEKACNWLEEMNKMCMYELEMILGGNFINDFKKAMEAEE
jgi:hypothetical protein